jgi:hypothetical protein
MTEQQQRIAISEVCGWNQSTSGKWFKGLFMMPDPLNPPDYLNDLNAMNEAENTLNEIQGCIFCDNLFKILNSSDGVSEFMKVNATAAQRAEAFLKTLNLWKP